MAKETYTHAVMTTLVNTTILTKMTQLYQDVAKEYTFGHLVELASYMIPFMTLI